jgi:predicted CoA-substrate-specific enzyme activase
VRLDENGKVLESAINEKCGAGAGAFVESMARAMEVDVVEFARLSLKATQSVPINAQCVIFAESEVVSLVHADTAREDIAKAVHDAMASRVGSMAQRVRIQKEVAMSGGVANNVGFLNSVKEFLKEEVLVPENPEYMTALGAALLGFETV